jgi:tRNA threonylcarbamoyladenosine biosynthesis protein TsaB
MNLLSLDTSSKRFSVAVSDGKKVLRCRNFRNERVLSSMIVPAIERILKDAAVPLTNIDGFAVGLGPGSFTSLRVGLSTVKGLAFATSKPLVGISSLDVIAMNAPVDGPVGVVCDARRGLIFGAYYEKRGEELRRLSEYHLCPVGNFLAEAKPRAFFLGDAVAAAEKTCDNKKEFRFATDAKSFFPSAKHLARLAYRRFIDGQVDDLHSIAPLYLYPENCQVVRKDNSKIKNSIKSKCQNPKSE